MAEDEQRVDQSDEIITELLRRQQDIESHVGRYMLLSNSLDQEMGRFLRLTLQAQNALLADRLVSRLTMTERVSLLIEFMPAWPDKKAFGSALRETVAHRDRLAHSSLDLQLKNMDLSQDSLFAFFKERGASGLRMALSDDLAQVEFDLQLNLNLVQSLLIEFFMGQGADVFSTWAEFVRSVVADENLRAVIRSPAGAKRVDELYLQARPR